MSKDQIEEKAPEEKPAESQTEEKRVSKYALPQRTIKISDETAHDQVMMILERNGVDLGLIEDEGDIETVENQIDIIKRAIMYGDFEVSEEDGEIIIKQNLRFKSKNSTVDSIIFGELRGKFHRKAATDGNLTNKSLSIMAKSAKIPDDTANKIIDNMRGGDLTTLEALSSLFL